MTHHKRGLVAGILFLAVALTPVAAVSGPYKDGWEAAERGDYKTAQQLWQPLVEDGQEAVQMLVGILYLNGEVIPQDYAEAAKWFRLAAGKHFPLAQQNLGAMHYSGLGFPQDFAKAVNWFRLAAEQDYANGQYSLGRMYALGQGVPQDYVEALKWFRLAADQGDVSGLHSLGAMYGSGQGVPQEYVLAHMWFNLAASRLLPGEFHDKAVKGRDEVAALMTPAQIAEAQKLAREWRPKGSGDE